MVLRFLVCYREWHLNCFYSLMMTRKNLSRRTFSIGVLAAGVCEAATPIIDMTGNKTPLINTSSNLNFFQGSSSKDSLELKSLYFDPEPEVTGATE
ncbi:MAG: hypothetical protein ACJ0DF_07970 [Paracoccaceae bacterium]